MQKIFKKLMFRYKNIWVCNGFLRIHYKKFNVIDISFLFEQNNPMFKTTKNCFDFSRRAWLLPVLVIVIIVPINIDQYDL